MAASQPAGSPEDPSDFLIVLNILDILNLSNILNVFIVFEKHVKKAHENVIAKPFVL